MASSAEAGEITFAVAGLDSTGSVSRADIALVFSDVAVGGSTWTALVPVNMVNIQTDNFGDDRFSPGVGCHVDMAYREHPEFLGNDSDSSEDCGCGPLGDVDFYDFRECDWYFAEGTECDWRADGRQEGGELIYLKDAYGPKLAPIALSSEVGTARPMVCSTLGLPDNHGNGLITSQE